MAARERPGIYTDYNTSGVIWSSGGRLVGIAAQAPKGEQNKVYTVSRTADAEMIFGSGSRMAELCSAALQNGAAQVAAVCAGAGPTADYAAAFAALESRTVCAVLCDGTQDSVHQLLKQSVIRASSAGSERVGIAAGGGSDPAAWAKGINCERMVLLAQTPQNEPDGCRLAAALAGRIAGMSDPSASLNGAKLEGAASLSAVLSEDELDAYVEAGITPLEIQGGDVAVIRAVTSRTETDGAPDRAFRELNTVLVMDDVLESVRTSLRQLMAGAKNNARTRSAIATQAAVLLESKYAAGIIDGYLQPRVYPLESDASVCVAEISFSVSHGLNQIHISAHITV